MKRSEWISIISVTVGLFATIGTSTAILFFKIGGVSEKVTMLEKNVEKLDVRMGNIENRMGIMENRMIKIESQMDQINFKVDLLWRDRLS